MEIKVRICISNLRVKQSSLYCHMTPAKKIFWSVLHRKITAAPLLWCLWQSNLEITLALGGGWQRPFALDSEIKRCRRAAFSFLLHRYGRGRGLTLWSHLTIQKCLQKASSSLRLLFQKAISRALCRYNICIHIQSAKMVCECKGDIHVFAGL